MNLRIQFAKSNSTFFDLALSLIKKTPTFKESGEGKAKIFSAEFEYYDKAELQSFTEIFRLAAGWKGMFVYFDDKLVDLYDVWDLLYHPLKTSARIIDVEDVGERKRLP